MTHSAPLQAHAGLSLQAPRLPEQLGSLADERRVSRLVAQHACALQQRGGAVGFSEISIPCVHDASVAGVFTTVFSNRKG